MTCLFKHRVEADVYVEPIHNLAVEGVVVQHSAPAALPPAKTLYPL
jgi:hypothetical protein